MDESKPFLPGRLLNELQGPSSLGMALSGGSLGFSASIISADAYVGFWTSLAFQMHAGFQFLSVAFGVAFVMARLRSNDVTFQIESTRLEDAPTGHLDQLRIQSRRLTRITTSMIYAQIVFFGAGAASFIWLMLLHFHRALYP